MPNDALECEPCGGRLAAFTTDDEQNPYKRPDEPEGGVAADSGHTAMSALTSLLRERRDDILQEWESRVGRLPAAHGLTSPTLRDHLPNILNLLADAVDRGDFSARPLEDLPEQHALVRFHEGYDLRQIVAEYRLLRHVVADLYTEHGDLSLHSRPKMKPLMVMNEAIDRAISEAVDQYATERDRVRDRFIAMLGHDQRNPLNTILFTANAQVERAGQLDAEAAKAAARTRLAAQRMDRMIRDLLDFARGRLGGGLTVVPTRFDARSLVGDAVRDIAHAHPDRDVRWAAEHATGNFEVNWDSDRIAQVVANLVGNALEHGEDPVVVQMTDNGEEIAIEVRNRGEISSDVFPRLFNPFVSDGPNTAGRGLGLGLYIVPQIARAHGGEARGASSDGMTTMNVTLPRRAHATPPASSSLAR